MKIHQKNGFATFASVLAISVMLLLSGGIFTILASNTSMIKTSGESLQAQYFAQLEADVLKLVPYDNLDDIDTDVWQNFSSDEDWQYKVKIGPEKSIDNTDAKMKIATIDVQKKDDFLERFSLQVPLSSQGSNTLPVGTILPYVGDLSEIPHGWALCDGTNGAPDLRNRFLEGSNVPGQFIKAGLPNIIGHISAHKMWENVYSTSGALYTSGSLYNQLGHDHGAHGDEISNIFFDASRANPIYGASTTVQPSSYTVYYIIRII